MADEKADKKPLEATFHDERVLVEAGDEATQLHEQSAYGILLDDGTLQLSLLEGLYLSEKSRIVVKDGEFTLDRDTFLSKVKANEPHFGIRYAVFRDIRNRGYVIKTALKFGADFRVYDRGIKPGDDHARWVVYPVHEGEQLTWYDFAAKNRVAHSTKKRLMMGIVDDEGDVTYYEIKWVRP